MYPDILSNALLSITAVMKLVKSLASPIAILPISSASSPDISFHTDLGMYARLAAEHFCPWYSKAPLSKATTSPLLSQSGWATMKSLPPVSPTILGYELSFGRASPISCHNPWKVEVEPVK